MGPGVVRLAQAQGAIDGLEEFGIINNVVGVNYDTTASNSSTAVGTVARIENYLDMLLNQDI